MLRVSMIGFGAIGTGVLELTAHDRDLVFDSIVVSPRSRARAEGWLQGRAALQSAKVVDAVDLDHRRPDLLVECAGHGAIKQHVLPALEAGVPCLIVSVGALAASGLAERLEASARRGGTQVQLLSGAIGAIDALAAARIGGLSSVRYSGRKPPVAWSGTPAQDAFDLDAIAEATLIFEGSARRAASLYPKNANVAATVALAGLGLDDTRVRLYADPAVAENVHHVEAEGAFGSFELTMRGKPLAANPKTSALTVYSVVRALGNRAHPLSI